MTPLVTMLKRCRRASNTKAALRAHGPRIVSLVLRCRAELAQVDDEQVEKLVWMLDHGDESVSDYEQYIAKVVFEADASYEVLKGHLTETTVA